MEEECPECGSDSWVDHPGAPGRVRECELCGELWGEEGAVLELLRGRAAAERGLDPRVFRFVEGLERVPGLRVDRVEGGDGAARTWPTVFFHLTGVGPAWLSALVHSLGLSDRGAHFRWSLELQYQHGLEYLFRPRLLGGRTGFDRDELDRAFADLERFGAGLERDRRASWWRPSFAIRGS